MASETLGSFPQDRLGGIANILPAIGPAGSTRRDLVVARTTVVVVALALAKCGPLIGLSEGSGFWGD
jgi:hypothetical protein